MIRYLAKMKYKMDANARTLQRGYMLEEPIREEEDEMVKWTCECGEDYVDGVSGDAEERMCYKCLEKEEEDAEAIKKTG